MQLVVADAAGRVSPSIRVELKRVANSVVVVTYVELISTREALRAGRVRGSRRGAAVLIAIPLQVSPVSEYAPQFVIMMHAASVPGLVCGVQKEHPSGGREQHSVAHCYHVNTTSYGA